MNNGKSSGVWDSKECALLLIDYQPEQMANIRSSDPKAVELNARYLAKAALAFDIPIVLSTVGVKMGINGPTIDFYAEADTEFVLGSAASHPYELALGNYSVHTSPASLQAGERRIAEIEARLQRREQ